MSSTSPTTSWPANVKEQIVRRREFKNIRLISEQVLFDDIRYFFYLTNDETAPASKIVFLANERYRREKRQVLSTTIRRRDTDVPVRVGFEASGK